jgi:hypothetical protein
MDERDIEGEGKDRKRKGRHMKKKMKILGIVFLCL